MSFEKNKGPTAQTVGPQNINTKSKTTIRNCASTAPCAPTAKEFSTLRAQLAMRSYTLEQLDDESFLAGRWGIFKALPDFSAVVKFCRAVGAAI